MSGEKAGCKRREDRPSADRERSERRLSLGDAAALRWAERQRRGCSAATTIDFGSVGQANWQAPQPGQRSGSMRGTVV